MTRDADDATILEEPASPSARAYTFRNLDPAHFGSGHKRRVERYNAYLVTAWNTYRRIRDSGVIRHAGGLSAELAALVSELEDTPERARARRDLLTRAPESTQQRWARYFVERGRTRIAPSLSVEDMLRNARTWPGADASEAILKDDIASLGAVGLIASLEHQIHLTRFGLDFLERRLRWEQRMRARFGRWLQQGGAQLLVVLSFVSNIVTVGAFVSNALR